MGQKLEQGLGISPVKYNAVDADVYPRLRLPRRRRDGQHVPGRTATSRRKSWPCAASTTTRKLNPQLQNFDQWLAANKSKVHAATQPAT